MSSLSSEVGAELRIARRTGSASEYVFRDLIFSAESVKSAANRHVILMAPTNQLAKSW